MAVMTFVEVTRIWSRLSLPSSDLAQDLSDAAAAAADPSKSPLDCPWNYATDRYFRARRVAWRVAFRIQREHGGVPVITVAADEERR
jgi:hypothetical protein